MSKHIPNSIPRQVLLQDVVADDLPIFYEQQLDPQANYMAAFTAKDPTDREAFMHHWQKILNDESITIKTICDLPNVLAASDTIWVNFVSGQELALRRNDD